LFIVPHRLTPAAFRLLSWRATARVAGQRAPSLPAVAQIRMAQCVVSTKGMYDNVAKLT
jgi:hypothetical protein